MAVRAGLFPCVILAGLAGAPPASADEPSEHGQAPTEPQVTTTFAAGRAYTTNALDREEALADWITALRGSVAVVFPHENGKVALSLAAEQSMHDRYAFEDDSALRLSLTTEHAASERLTLGAELGLSLDNEGDDIEIDDFILGTRTRTLSAGGAVKAAYRISDTLALTGELSGKRARPGLTSFEAALLDPEQLSPLRDSIGAGLRLAHTAGGRTLAASGGIEFVQVGQPGEPPYDFRLARQFARGEFAWKSGGLSVSAAAGAERLQVPGGALEATRPLLAAEVKYSFASGAEMRGALATGLDLVGGDDPLGSWLRTVEAEAGLPLGERLTLLAGASYFQRENFLLGYDEAGWGAFVGARVRLWKGMALEADLGRTSRRPLPDGADIDSIDASLSLTFAFASPDAGTR
jgi:hypothetical protein